ncbi:MAG TPA: hypothetical protein VES68_02185 [Candidatus Sulfotelmatobacter sp.]|nr:hypothetical protein [Candidatus Sulfotelmatobacter sp.]
MSAERGPQSVPERIRKKAIASWEEVDGMLELRTHNNIIHHGLYERYKTALRDYYDTVYGLASGIEAKEPGPILPRAGLAYHFRIVRETVFGQPEKVSKGWAKHIRTEKSASGK